MWIMTSEPVAGSRSRQSRLILRTSRIGSAQVSLGSLSVLYRNKKRKIRHSDTFFGSLNPRGLHSSPIHFGDKPVTIPSSPQHPPKTGPQAVRAKKGLIEKRPVNTRAIGTPRLTADQLLALNTKNGFIYPSFYRMHAPARTTTGCSPP